MGTETATPIDAQAETRLQAWQAGLVGGIAGGIIFGLLMTMEMQPIIEMAIPGMYGLGPSLITGWAIHMFHSVVLGVVFAVFLRSSGLDNLLNSNFTVAVAGLAYGIVLWIALASFVMPVWVGVMTEMGPPVPDWNIQSLMGHAVFGIVLGLIYAVLAK